MLRVRPIHITSRMDQWERLLTDLGLVKTLDEPTRREFDAGSGRLALQFAEQGSPEDGTTSLGVEVGDPAEFARRTNEAGAAGGGTSAEVVDADAGSSVRITAQDGFSFLADAAVRGADGSWAPPAESDPGLAIVGVWFAEDAVAAAGTLRDIGAEPRPVPGSTEPDGGVTEAFTAKNGGVLMIGAGTGAGQAGLGFEYDGDLEALRGRLLEAGHVVAALEDIGRSTLHIASPDADGAGTARAIWVSRASRTG